MAFWRCGHHGSGIEDPLTSVPEDLFLQGRPLGGGVEVVIPQTQVGDQTLQFDLILDEQCASPGPVIVFGVVGYIKGKLGVVGSNILDLNVLFIQIKAFVHQSGFQLVFGVYLADEVKLEDIMHFLVIEPPGQHAGNHEAAPVGRSAFPITIIVLKGQVGCVLEGLAVDRLEHVVTAGGQFVESTRGKGGEGGMVWEIK